MAKSDNNKYELCDVLRTEYNSFLEKDAFTESGTDEAALEAIYAKVHNQEPPLHALCLSGGGIRSATFNLGVMQGLAKAGILEKFHYLSTVSGGGYIGGWLSAWISRHPQGLVGVIAEMSASAGCSQGNKKPDGPEPEAITRLRAYSNYLTPKLGLFNADTWTLIATFLRNMALNWLILVPLLAAVLMLPRFGLLLFSSAAQASGAQWLGSLGSIGLGMIALAVGYIGCDLPSIGNWRGSQNKFILFFLCPFIIASFCLTAYWAGHANLVTDLFDVTKQRLHTIPDIFNHDWLPFILLGAFVHAVSWGIFFCAAKRSPRSRKIGATTALKLVVSAGVSGAIGGLTAYWCATYLHFSGNGKSILFTCFGPMAIFTIFLVTGLFLVGFVSRCTTDEDREWWARSMAWLLIVMVGWTALSTLVLYGPGLFLKIKYSLIKWALGASGGIAGAIISVLGYSDKTHTFIKKKNLSELALQIAAVVFILVLGVALSLLPACILPATAFDLNVTSYKSWLSLHTINSPLFLFLGLLAFSGISAWFVNVNKFSLNSMYRNRLILAYLGASRHDKKDSTTPGLCKHPTNHDICLTCTKGPRAPNPFTGFDSNDNCYMMSLPQRPLLVVNMALNLAKTSNLAWQQRKAESFTVTCHHSGNFRIGYRNSDEYGGGKIEPISLGTAVSISGAAVSPNMGYHSSPLITFLLALFNVRLGWWLGNPKKRYWKNKGPNMAFAPLIMETLGLTTDEGRFVYLSDGGHFENLGLYEMVLRRCRCIVVCDSGCDKKYGYEDLGNAIRKIRIDLGIPIDLDLGTVEKNGYALGSICYEAVDGEGSRTGKLIYLKPTITKDVTADVLNYKRTNDDFPHQSTADQWFDESQFESYRMLGLLTAENVIPVIKGKEEKDQSHA